MSDDKSFVPAVLDREINSIEADAFGHRHFAILLQGYVEAERNEPPYSIGLLGKWGSGKSSIKSLYLSSLADDASKDTGKKSRGQRIFPITFNAWRFGGEQIKRALLREVFLELGGDRNELDEALFRHVQRSQPEKRKLTDFLMDALDQWGWSLVQALLVFVVVIATVAGTGKLVGLTSDQAIGWLLGASVVVAGAIVKFLLDSSKIPRHANVTRVESPRTSAEEYEDLLVQQIHRFKSGKTNLDVGKHCKRLVIFIDDLDRLSPEEMVSGLDAVRTFMEIPKKQLPEGLGIVFVISCDEDRIADALSDKPRRITNPDLPGAVFTHSDAHRFLDRIFQFRLEIPPFPKRDMRSYAEKSLLTALPQLKEELPEGANIETLIDRMIHVGVGTPRNALQIVNAFVQSWWVAKRREREGAGTTSAGGLQEGAVTKHPLALGAVCALRVDFPDFYRDLQREPDLIARFTDVFIRGQSLEDQPESVRNILKRYAEKQDGKKEQPQVAADHRPLRRFITSLQGLRWPRALRPLLFLSQDPVTRRFGDKALDLYESFVSGDDTGVLTSLAREHDSKEFSEAEMRLLHGLVEELDRESDVRCNNAAAVLAALADRYPESSAHLLLSPLARRLSESSNLRWRLGILNIRQVAEGVPSGDKRQMVVRLVDDLLKTSGEIDFRLETGEKPSLDEAMDMARGVCTLALNTRRYGPLGENADSMLLTWLESRRVAIGDKEQSLAFTEFEAWITEHEEWLLPALGSTYTELVLDQLEDNQLEALDLEQSLRRCQIVFNTLWDSGENSRVELWSLLTRMVAPPPVECVSLASSFIQSHVDSPSKASISSFVTAFAGRLAESDESDDASISTQRSVLIEIVTKRQGDLDESCGEALSSLITEWSQDENTAEFATDLLSPAYGRFPEIANTITTDWSSRILSNLSGPCIDWLARGFGSVLVEQHRRHLIKQLALLHQQDNINENQSKRYRRFMDSVTEDGLTTEEMQGHLNNMLTQVKERHANPHDYLRRVFAPLPRCLIHCDGSQVGPMLQSLFSNTKGDPALFGWLHTQMADHWPQTSEDISQYDPEQVFTDAHTIATQNPSQETMPGALSSMTTLLRRNIVSEDRSTDVVDAACQLWQYHSKQATETISSVETLPSAQFVASMIDSVSGENADENERLSNCWNTIAARSELDHRIETGIQVLSKPAKGTQEIPDLCLKMWVEARDDDHELLLEALLTAQGLNDDQRRRVWVQVEHAEGLDADFLFRVIPKVVGLEESPQTVSELLSFEDQISARANSEEQRYALGQRVVEAFRASSSQEAMNRLASWLKNLKVDAVLKELNQYGDLTEDEVAILDSQFSTSRQWKKVKPD